MEMLDKIRDNWLQLYGNDFESDWHNFQNYLQEAKRAFVTQNLPKDWYSKTTVYSLYVDLFADNFEGLHQKLDYLEELGVECLWLLPILKSPMFDAGYDVQDYQALRRDLFHNLDLLDEQRMVIFEEFLEAAHQRNIRIVFDIVLNHCSDQHEYFQEARKGVDSPFHDYFIWSDTPDKYSQARIIFKGLCQSNWEYDSSLNKYYLHRFYPSQPDWNYRNPKVLEFMIRTIVFWKQKGVDGFRLDAIPYLWKEDDTNCESLPECHWLVQIIRYALDYLEPGTLLLAEACQPMNDIRDYFAMGNECHAAYHFPMMRNIFSTIATKDASWMLNGWKATPSLPENCYWFFFLRCHDELTLEMASEEEKDLLNRHYCLDPEWSFREGEGISARLFDLFKGNQHKILLAYSILFTLPGIPIIYYGDELGKRNDQTFFDEMYQKTKQPDTRNFCRGKINWDEHAKGDMVIWNGIKQMLHVRKTNSALQTGEILMNPGKPSTLCYQRKNNATTIQVFHNLDDVPQSSPYSGEDLLSGRYIAKDQTLLQPYEFCWIQLPSDQH